jgi:hypothetical protein
LLDLLHDLVTVAWLLAEEREDGGANVTTSRSVARSEGVPAEPTGSARTERPTIATASAASGRKAGPTEGPTIATAEKKGGRAAVISHAVGLVAGFIEDASHVALQSVRIAQRYIVTFVCQDAVVRTLDGGSGVR